MLLLLLDTLLVIGGINISSVRIEVELCMGIVRDSYLGVIVHAYQTASTCKSNCKVHANQTAKN